MTTTTSGNRQTVSVHGTEVELFSGGSGPPLLFLHGAGGNSGWQHYHEELSKDYTVYVPSQPGFNGTERPDWVYSINDVCHFNSALVNTLGLDKYILMGSSMGGWIAAEMAAMNCNNLEALILIDAAGIKPESGEIAEIFMVSNETRMRQRFHDPSQVANYEHYTRDLNDQEKIIDHSNKEMASRLCWKPYLHNLSLPYYLNNVSVPTLIVWGEQDAIIPVECADLFRKAIPNSQLEIISNCGHSPAIEKPNEFVSTVTGFLASIK